MQKYLYGKIDGGLLPQLLQNKLDKYDADHDMMPDQPNVFYGEALLIDAVLQLIEIVKFQRHQIQSLSERINK